ncbi:TonB-dependent receptor domain-containing protein [Sphingomonas oligophenolica]|uniref:TonB-dependent receptor domain-containing protein n=1 Tax=Sphingomonas oligophenolica TaxID=301154 RepID=UPI00138698E0|nr:TonB-dependent receptor [Sphingomonas oligophenolica]
MATPSDPQASSVPTQSQVQSGDATPGPTVAAAPIQAETKDSVAAPINAAGNGPDIVVTGTNLNSGFRAPTPVTVTTAEQLSQSSPNNLADGLIKLPVFGGSLSTSSPGSNATAGNVGQNLLNLRGLGTNRNLVLLDGRRIVANNTDFAIDVNTLPQNLVSRVDVVTGGASAAYGSDAVAGVINFVLDTKFEGVKGEIANGISTYGDLPSGKYSLAVGKSLFGGRLHLIASTEYYVRSGLGVYDQNDRKWYTDPAGLIPNTNGTMPSNVVVPSIRASNGTAGGLIYTGPAGLKGTQFLPGGTAAPFNYGTLSSAGFQNGGDGFVPNFGFTPDQRRSTSFFHAGLDVTPDITAYAEFGYAYSHTRFKNNAQPFTGAGFAFTIYNTNPYLPASVKAAMAAAGATSFRLGRYLADFPEFEIETNANVTREAVGLKGRDLFGRANLNWEASYSAGQTSQYLSENNIANLRNVYAAADAVVNPQTGQIVCRSQFYSGTTFLPGGTGRDPGCKPINLIGFNASNAALADTINGTSFKKLLIHQNVFAAKIAGDLGDRLQLGAGPISFATGFEYRKDSANQRADAVSGSPIDLTGVRGAPAALQGRVGGYRFFNPLPFSGSQTVKEGFLELGVPLLKDVSFARSLNLDGAVRYTDYSLAGGVTTWKGGVDYEPIEGIRLRGTVSRDVRAPNLLEIFNTALQNSQNVLYPSSTSGATTPSLTTTTGNPDLKPERALTQTYGVVLSPVQVPALHFSVDYYKIKLNGAIGALSAQNVVDFCAAGEQSYCSLVNFSNGVVNVNIKPLNLNVLQVEGLDFELSYRHNVFSNPLGLRLLVNRGLSNFSQAPNASPLVALDSAIAPKWKAQAQISYDVPGVSLFVNERFVSSVRMDPNKVEGVFTNDNSVPAIFYTDLTTTFKIHGLGGDHQLYLSIENLFNQDPPVDVIPPTSTSSPTNAAYDRIGRYFTAGFRFKF